MADARLAYPALSLISARTMAIEKRHAVDVEHRDPAQERRDEKRVAVEPTPTTPPAAPRSPSPTWSASTSGSPGTQADMAGRHREGRSTTAGLVALPFEITRSHVHELLDTLVAQGMTVGVNRIQAVISRLFTIALDRSLIDAHPAARMIKRFQERPSNRVLTDDELRALWQGWATPWGGG